MRMILLATFLATPAFAESALDHVAACSGGDQEACLQGARLAQAEGDNALLATFSKTGCKHGNLISCSDEGMMIIAGLDPEGDLARGVDQDSRKAARYYQQGCDGGSAAACRNLGLMILDGDTPQTGKPSPEQLFDRACDLGDPLAC